MAEKKPEAQESSKKSFEENLLDLERIVRGLEEGNLGLEESLVQYEQGIGLLRRCHEMLQHAEAKVNLLSGIDSQGNPVYVPFSDDAGTTLEEKAQSRGKRRGNVARKSPAQAGSESSPVDEEIDSI